jgi:hypothetical protein
MNFVSEIACLLAQCMHHVCVQGGSHAFCAPVAHSQANVWMDSSFVLEGCITLPTVCGADQGHTLPCLFACC